EQAGLPPGAVLAGRTDLGAFADLVAAARLVVSSDTGTGHLATAYGTPSVLVFGPTEPTPWGPRSGPHVVLQHGTRTEAVSPREGVADRLLVLHSEQRSGRAPGRRAQRDPADVRGGHVHRAHRAVGLDEREGYRGVLEHGTVQRRLTLCRRKTKRVLTGRMSH